MKSPRPFLILLCILLLGAAVSALTVSYAFETNGFLGFPLDDSWIHLQFAHNLHDYGAFSYYRNEMVTSGSTAPLYTLLLATGFFLTEKEFLLSYVLGVGFFLAAGVMMYRLSLKLIGPDPLLPLGATLVFMMDPRLHWSALSGMETTLFIFLLLSGVVFFLDQRPWHLGLVAGLLLWVRPEAVLLLAAVGLHWAVHRWWVRKDKTTGTGVNWSYREIAKPAIVVAVLGAGYVVFNMALSGTALPNAYAAKLTYYVQGGERFLGQAMRYVTGGHQLVLIPFLISACALVIVRCIRRQPVPTLVAVLWIVGIVAAYWWKLPYLYQNGRYLMPVLPFTILLSFWGARALIQFAEQQSGNSTQRLLGIVLPLLFVVIAGTHVAIEAWRARPVYQEFCAYIGNRQVRAAQWIKEHLPADAVVATHDIGAIGFYGERKIVDMVGLVSPDAVRSIRDTKELKRLLTEKRVTHVAVLRSWFEIVNVNPLFQTDERYPETMEMFAYDPVRMHFTERDVAVRTEWARQALGFGDVSTAGQLLTDVVSLDPRSSRGHYLLAWASLLYGYADQAREEARTATGLHPEYWDAYNLQAEIALSQSRFDEAERLLYGLLERNPAYAIAYHTLAEMFRRVRKDSARADEYERQYRRLVPSSTG